MSDRETAYKILNDIFNNDMLYQDALASAFVNAQKAGEDVNKAWVTRLVKGVTERYLSLVFLIEEQAGRKFEKIHKNVRIVLLLGLYQGMYMNVPVSAAVNESVKLAVKHKLAGLRGFVNGVLRGIFREFEGAESADEFIAEKAEAKYPGDEDKQLSVITSTPVWIIKNYENYSDDVKSILYGQFSEQVLTISPLRSHTSDTKLQEAFKKENTGFSLKNFSASGEEFTYYEISPGKAVYELPSFKKGYYIVQDPASMLASEMVPLIPEMKVIDVCAAPGGKAIHLADRITAVSGHVTACDISATKVDKINDTIKRTGLVNITTLPADAAKNIKNFNNFFDVAVCDLPCSGLGVIAKKPDIKYKTGESDPAELSKLQKSILENVIRYVKCGGYICFSTCTLTKCENEDNVKFLCEKGFTEIKSVTLLPDREHDGFFISILKKNRED